MTQTWSGALAWRLRRHLLDPIGTGSAADVVRRLGAVPATPAAAAEAMIRARQERSRPGEVERSLVDGSLIKVFAFRGATYLMTPEDGGVHLALRAASRMWERATWRRHYGLEPSDWASLRKAVRDALGDGPMTLDELAAAVTAHARFRHLGDAFLDRSATFLKPLTWLGDMSFGPARDGRVTFQRLDQNPRWAGLPEVDEAGRRAVEAYLRVYGPATADHLRYWLGNGLGAGRKRVESWIADLGDRLSGVDIEGARLTVWDEDLEQLLGTPPSANVRLLPGFDPWVIGPGTADVHVVPPARRALVTRRANVVIVGGTVVGTWALDDDDLVLTWFAETSSPPPDALAGEVARLGAIERRPLTLHVRSA